MRPACTAIRRDALPQLGADVFLTHGRSDTTLVFLAGRELPHFAAFHLLKDADGEAALRRALRPDAAPRARPTAQSIAKTG